jgi:hypothetical protein
MAENPDPAAAAPPAAPDAAPSAAAAAAVKPPTQPGEAAAAAGSEQPTPTPETPAAPAAAAAPEKYSLTPPADNALVDAQDVTAIETMARNANLTNEEAQAVLETAAREATTRHNTWLEETRADTEVGGANLEASQRASNQVLDRFMPATDPDRAALERLLVHDGLGKYRPVVKFLARIGRAMGEDATSINPRASGDGQRRSAADVMFGGNKQT